VVNCRLSEGGHNTTSIRRRETVDREIESLKGEEKETRSGRLEYLETYHLR